MALTRYLLDTNRAGKLLDERAALWDRLADIDRNPLGVSIATVGELWFMVFNSRRVCQATAFACVHCCASSASEFDAKAAIEFGRLRVELREKGRPIPTFDVLIAAVARINSLALLTADQHCNVVHNLAVENWLA